MAEDRKYQSSKLLLPFILVGLAISAWFNTEWNIPSFGGIAHAEVTDSVHPPSIGKVLATTTTTGIETFDIAITSEESSHVIHFTTDGSTPTTGSPVYTGPFKAKPVKPELSFIRTAVKWKPPLNGVANCPVIRAIAVDAGHRSSAVAAYTDVPAYSHLPIVAITGDPNELFGKNDGIYVVGNTMFENATVRELIGKYHINWWDMPANYHRRGSAWQRAVNIQYIEDGAFQFNVQGGIRLNGNATRSFPQKSLRLYAPEGGFNHAFFGSAYPTNYEHLILRNSGNDWGRTLFRDILTHEVMGGTAVEVQPYKQANVYLNGEYWGIHNLRPRMNENYLAAQYGVALEELTVLEKNAELYFGKGKRATEFKSTIDSLSAQDLSDPTIYKQATDLLDLDNFIDYLWAEIYVVNTDWPQNNVKFFRTHPKGQKNQAAKWKFILNDTDYGFGYTYPESYETNMFTHLDQSSSYVGVLFHLFCQNEDFCEQFVTRGERLLETQFNTIRINRIIDQLRGNIAGEMEYQIRRWRKPSSVEQWEAEIETVRRFVAKRPAILRTQMDAFFKAKLEL